MEIVKCKNGHSYDPSVTPECPECARMRAEGTIPFDGAGAWGQNGGGGADDIGKTQPVHGFGTPEQDWREQKPTEAAEDSGWKHWSDQEYYEKAANGEPGYPTKPRYFEEEKPQKVNPVVGWLVCISGPSRGVDYKIHADNNYIGRATYMDISISGDDTISRENHAILAYDTREKLFYFAPGSGRGIVRINGKAVLMMTELHAYDKIEIGRSTLMFLPFCGEEFSWEEMEG